MLSNLESQLKSMNMLNRIDEVFQEVQVVRRDMGYPPLATPFSQMVGAQATTNVMMGKRYGLLSREVKDYVKGAYGKAPGEISQELKDLVLTNGSEVITCRPGSLLEPEWEKGRQAAGGAGPVRGGCNVLYPVPQRGGGVFEEEVWEELNVSEMLKTRREAQTGEGRQRQ